MVAKAQLGQNIVQYITSILSKNAEGVLPVSYEKDISALEASLKSESYETFCTSVLKTFTEPLLALDTNFAADVEGCFSMVASLIMAAPRSNDTKLSDLYYQTFSSVSQKTHSASLLSLRCIINLFNLSESFTDIRFEGLLCAIKYANASGLLSLMEPFITTDITSTLFERSSLSVTQCRELYRTIVENFTFNDNDDDADDDNSIMVLKFIYLYLKTFEKTDESATELAVQGIMCVIKNPISSFTAGIDLVSLSAVSSLSSHKTYGKLYELLQIVSVKELADYQAFYQKNESMLQEFGLDHDQCLSNMRLLSICSLGEAKSEVAYEVVMKKLEVTSDSEVEMWVVKAVTSNLVDASIDQLRKVVTFKSAIYRKFGDAQWQAVSAKLKLWKKNVGNLLDSMEASA